MTPAEPSAPGSLAATAKIRVKVPLKTVPDWEVPKNRGYLGFGSLS